jgi:hypothetical protein
MPRSGRSNQVIAKAAGVNPSGRSAGWSAATLRSFPATGWRPAARWHLLLLAAVERQPDTAEGRALVVPVRFRWLFVARQALMHMADGRVLASAADGGRRLIETFEADPQRRPWHVAEVLIALAALYFEPFNVVQAYSDSIDLSGLRRWTDRSAEEILDPVEVPDGVEPEMPDLHAALDIGEEHRRLAAEIADPVVYAAQPHCLRVSVEGPTAGGPVMLRWPVDPVRAVGTRSLPGVVRRDPHPGYRRAVLVRLTEPCLAVTDRLTADYETAAAQLFAGLPPGQVQQFLTMLATVGQRLSDLLIRVSAREG